MTTKQVLEAARALISDRSRWVQGELWNHDGQVCAVGAINQALGHEQGYLCEENEAALKALAAVVPHGEGIGPDEAVFEYNDDDNTSHECILTAFDAAIEQAQ